MSAPLADRLVTARAEFDARTKPKPGEKSGAMDGVVRGFFLSIVFPQLGKAAKAEPEKTERAIAEMVSLLVRILDLTPDQVFPPATEPTVEGDAKPN